MKTAIWIAVLFFQGVTAVSPHLQKRSAPKDQLSSQAPSADFVFGLLKGEASFGPLTQNAWEVYLRSAKLVPWQEGAVWRFKADDGEVRASRFFANGKTDFFLLFFPSNPSRLSDATLAWMYRTASSFAFEEADEIDMTFPQESLGDGQGTRSESITVFLDGRLSRTAVHISWKAASNGGH